MYRTTCWFVGLHLVVAPVAVPTVICADHAHGSPPGMSSASGRPDLSRGGVPVDAWERIVAQLRETQYDALPAAGAVMGEWLLRNPDLGIESRFSRGGVNIGPLGNSEDASWSWGMRLSGFGPVGATQPVAGPEVVALGNRVEYRRPGLTEWYLNDRRGLEQGFTIVRAPVGDPERLALVMELTGSVVPILGGERRSLLLRDTSGTTVLRYGQLHAYDAEGEPLSSEMALDVTPGGIPTLRIEVDVAGASFPIVVDPLITTEVAKLTASDATVSDQFAFAVSISGDTVVVGAPGDDDAGSASGSAYVFERNTGGADSWGQVVKLTASDAAAGEQFGRSVSISGDTVVIGAHDDAGSLAGSAYVFERNAGGADSWAEVAKLTAADGVVGDQFGHAVSISANTIAVTARWDDDAGSDSGSAYVFERNEGGADGWGQLAKLTASDASEGDQFGRSVSISGDRVVVGAHTNDDAGTSSGAAYVFGRNEGGTSSWGQLTKLTASDAAEGDLFGRSVSISGDTVIVGAVGDDELATNSGSAYVFQRNVGGADSWGQLTKLTASDGAGSDQFGHSVSISGDRIVVGAFTDDDAGEDSGSSYVFERNAGGADGWGQVAKLTASEAAADDLFGFSVSVSGDTVAVGAFGDDDAGVGSGAGYVSTIRGCEWLEVAKPIASDAATNDLFGTSVSISGDTLVVGANQDQHAGSVSGSAYVFERNAGGADGWGQVAKLTASDETTGRHFGASVSISGDTVVVGATLTDDDAVETPGSAHVFERNAGGADGWGQVAKLRASDAAARHGFGRSVSISGNTVVVGADGDDDAGDGSGSAYVFERNAKGVVDSWGQVAKLTAFDAAAHDRFGRYVSISRNTVVIGAHQDDDAGPSSGSAYVFERNAGGADSWNQVAKLTASDAAAYDAFGSSISISGDTVVIGAKRDDDAGGFSGSAYVFGRNAGGADSWGQVAKLTASDAAARGFFGRSVSISGDTIVSMAYSDNDTGAGYVFERNAGGADSWDQVAKFAASDAAPHDEFGKAVSISGDTVVVGAFFDRHAGGLSGSAYVFNFICPICGDGVLEIPEECDDGAGNSNVIPFACREHCAFPACGDGIIDEGEECGEPGLACPPVLPPAIGVDCRDCRCPTGLVVFVTSSKTDGSLGGIAGADVQCNALAAGAGLLGTYRAWLSDSLAGPSTTFTPDEGPYAYVRLDGTVIATDLADLTDGKLLAPINIAETGAILSWPAGSRIWTGTSADGTPRDGGALCADWTTDSAFGRGAQGRVDRTDSTWSFSGAAPCNKERRLYCFQQGTAVPPSDNPKTIFVTSTTSNGNLGGAAGADATCNALASAANLPGTFHAWLSDSAVDPNSTFSREGTGYFRVDGTLVATGYADLTSGTLLAPINVTETGVVLEGPVESRAWTGTRPSGDGLDGAKCADWTSSSVELRGAQGRSSSTASTWSFSGASPCDRQRRIYCVEQ